MVGVSNTNFHHRGGVPVGRTCGGRRYQVQNPSETRGGTVFLQKKNSYLHLIAKGIYKVNVTHSIERLQSNG